MNFYSFKYTVMLLGLITAIQSHSQTGYWQQAVDYDIEVDLNVKKNCMNGDSEITYFNNSPDTITRIFCHLYFNAFQPNSMMDVRSRTIADPDPRVQDRIVKLDEKEIGFYKFKEVEQDDKEVDYEVSGTILEINLAEPVLPGEKTVIELEYEAQVPIQIRRNGRDNAEGIRYSMSQWYPKICEYDEDGWHPNPYIGREFYGIWGDFKVSINIHKDYIVGAGGVLINDVESQRGRKRTWIFEAKNVHDFMWAADPDYTHYVQDTPDGIAMHFYYQPGENTTEKWEMLPDIMAEAFDFIQKRYGEYPYPVYAFIQGGDGGMEYPMGTLITGERSLISLVGVSVHELMHSWYQMMLGMNEAHYPWMDEGFTSYASAEVMNHLKSKGLIPGFQVLDNPHNGSMTGYRNFASTPFEEPLSTHADHYKRNQAYGIASYVKGAVFLHQLSYIIGKPTFDRVMLAFYNKWKFKHPDARDFIRVAERESHMVLDWYMEHWVNTINKIDYAIDTAVANKKSTVIRLSKKGDMMMPIDLVIKKKDGSEHMFHIPLRMMRGSKPDEGLAQKYSVAIDWPWTHPEYELEVPYALEEIESIEIDPSNRLADILIEDNKWPRESIPE